MREIAFEWLQKNGYNLPETNIYNYINVWNDWYMNNTDFHTYTDFYGTKRKMFTLGMAKRVSEDWASIIFTEKDEISTDQQKNKAFIQNLIKDDGLDLRNEIAYAIEKATWSGTCAGVLRLKNLKVKKDTIVKDKDTKFELELIPADRIIPLRVEQGKIIDVAFVSDILKNSKKIICIEIHILGKNGYEITNVFIDEETRKEVDVKNIIKNMKTMSSTPIFSILETPIVNNIKNNLGLGISIYGHAIDQLKACDVVYNNFVMDFHLGGKKMIYNKRLIKYKTITYTDENGETQTKEMPIYPDDVTKQQWMEIGDGLPTDELIKEYNPDLRVDDNEKGIQKALDLLSFKCGFGAKYYEFNGGSVVTATQYVGDRQDLIKNAKKYRDNLDRFINGIIKGSLLLGRWLLGENVTEECDVEVTNRDGLLVSDEEIKEQLRQEYNMGLISKQTYLMKTNGWTEEEAQRELELINNENQITNVVG
jgi:A118 family predicted phage portal protein